MTVVSPGETAYVEGFGTVNVYNNDVDGSSGEQYLVPSDNISGSMYSQDSAGGLRAVPVAASRSPSVYVINSRFPGADYQMVYQGYEDAYMAETGRKFPGELGTLLILAIVFIITALLVIGAAYVLCHFIDASSGDTTTDAGTDANGNTILKSCAKSVLGGTNCVFYNTGTGKTSDAGSSGGLNDTFSNILLYGGIAALILGGGYVVVKYILPELSRRSKEVPYEQQGLITKGYSQMRRLV